MTGPASFDVFLLYNHLEIESVEPVYQKLRDLDVSAYLDEHDLPPGANWREFENTVLSQSVIAVLFLGPHGWGESQRQLAIAIAGTLLIVPVLINGAPRDALDDAGGVFRRLQYVELDPSDPAAVRQLAAAIHSFVAESRSRTGSPAPAPPQAAQPQPTQSAPPTEAAPPNAGPSPSSPPSAAPPPPQFIPLEIPTRAVSELTNSDLLGFSDYADALADLIKNEYTQKPITIGISAPWGMGKTWLMRMIRERLIRTHSDGRTTNLPTAWFDAWKYDREDSLWAALALEVLNQSRSQIGYWRWVKVWAQLNWQRLDRDAMVRSAFNTILYLTLFALFLALVYPILRSKLAADEAAKYVAKAGLFALYVALLKVGYEAHKRLAIPFDQKIARYVKRPDYTERVGFIGSFQEDFKKVVAAITGSAANPLVIFIDDLDRCSPSKTAEVLEAINLLLDSERCVFVIGMDASAVAASLEAKYKDVVALTKPSDDPGGLTLGQRFLEKIVQIEFRLPPPTDERMHDYVDSILGAAARTPSLSVDKQKVAEVKDEIAKKQETGKSLEEAARSVGGPEFSHDVVTEAKMERFAESFDTYTVVRDAVRLAASKLGNNPRKVKRFVNAFRLQALIANRRKLLEGGVIHLDLLANWLVAETRWPELMTDVLQHPDLVSRAREARSIAAKHEADPTPDNRARMDAFMSDPAVKRLAEAQEALGFIDALRTDAGDRLQDYLHLGRIVGEAKAQQAASGA